MSQQAYLNELMSFITHSPTPFHAVASMVSKLSAAGYRRLDVASHWDLVPGGCYYITKNDSTIIAFQLPSTRCIAKNAYGRGAYG